MDIEALKDKLGDETFAQLKTHIDDLTGQRDAARGESISGRKGLKDRVAALEAENKQLKDGQSMALEKLGVDTLEDIDGLPDAKGAAEAAKQYEAKLKRLQRERDEAVAAADGERKLRRDSLQRAAVAEALGGHEFIARDVVETFVAQRLAWEGDDLVFKTDDGKLVAVKDGVAGIAKTRPELLKPTGTGGAGVRNGNAGGGASKTIPEAEFNALAPKDRAARMAEGYTLTSTT